MSKPLRLYLWSDVTYDVAMLNNKPFLYGKKMVEDPHLLVRYH